MLQRALFHVAALVFFRRRARYLFILRDERRFEFLDLLVVLYDFALYLWHRFQGLRNILLQRSWTLYRLLPAIKGRPRNFRPALQLRRHFSILNIVELILDGPHSVSSQLTTFVVVVYVLLR